jgi:hypothetical protein
MTALAPIIIAAILGALIGRAVCGRGVALGWWR